MRVVRNAAIYFLSSAINSGISFLLLPVLTRYLPPEEYGHVAIFTSLVSFGAPFVGMSTTFNINRKFFHVSRDEMARMVSNLCAAVAFNLALVLALVSAAELVLGDISGIRAPWVQYAALIAATQALIQFPLTIYRNLGQAVRYGVYQVAQILVNIGTSLVLIIAVEMGWKGRALGYLASSVVLAVVGLVQLRRAGYLLPDLSRQRLRDIYALSLPLVPHALAGISIGMSGRFFLDAWAGKQEVGLYAVASTMASMLNMVMTAFNQAWSPWVYQQFAALDDARRRRIVRQTWAVFAGLLVLSALVPAVAPLVLRIMTTRDYAGAAPYVSWQILGYAFHGMYMMVMHYLVQAGQTGRLAAITSFSAILNLGANYVLLVLFGPVGVSQSIALSYGVGFALVWWQAQRAMPMPWFSAWRR